MPLTLRILQVDVPARRLDEAVGFWAATLSAEPVDAPGGFVHLVGATAALEVHVQPVGDERPRYHLDLEADDRDAEVARLTAAGATEVARFDDRGFTVLSDPAGLPLCVIDPDAAVPTPVSSAQPERGYLSGVFVDVTAPLVHAELGFWADALDLEVVPTSRPETYTALHGVQGPGGPVRFELQRIGDGDVPRHHVDLEATDVAAEVARLEALGATRITAVEGWVVLRDPVGNLLCVVPAGS